MEISTENSLLKFLPSSVENIRNIYNLDEGRIVQSVDILEDWIKKQKHFLNKNFSRRFLDITIITCKGSVEKAKMQIDKLCTLRTLLPKFFISNVIEDIGERIHEISSTIILPKMTKDYERVVALHINSKQFTSSMYMDFYKYAIVMAEYIKAHDYANGFIIVEDLREVNLMDFMTKLNFIEFQQFITILTEGFGARLKGIHLISKSKVIDVFVKTIKSVLSEKLANRIHVHPGVEDLHQVIDSEILPIEFGGKERSIKELRVELSKVICSEEHKKYLEVMKASATDESLRETDKFNEQHMGLPGSFRTLTVD